MKLYGIAITFFSAHFLSISKAVPIDHDEIEVVQFSSWPRGSYGFLMHENGCPLESFKTGFRTIDTENTDTFNLWPLDSQLKGGLNHIGMILHFCSKTTSEGNYSWPSGSYCLHRVGGSCPKGFQDGFILIDEEDSQRDQNAMHGTLPDGEYDANTKFQFCCRHDRSPSLAIQLPNGRPFYLYPVSSKVCQKVVGMTNTLERFLVDTEDSLYKNDMFGNYPDVVDNKVGILFHICRYNPTTEKPGASIQPTDTREKGVKDKMEEELPVRTDWPSGSYGLPMAGDHCPDYYNFTQSYIYQDTEDLQNKNRWPDDVAMIGPLKAEGYRTHYCSKSLANGSYEWPAGDYCIHRVGGECPNAFTEGSVRFDDEDSQNANDREGQLPDGVFDNNTLLFFCCRADGNASKDISLPNNKPFYLYRYKSECQKIVNMTAQVQVLTWDDENNNNKDNLQGETPQGFMDDVGISLYFCLYEPLEASSSPNKNWPRGRYALPMTSGEECPDDSSFLKGFFNISLPSGATASTSYGNDTLRQGRVERGHFDGGICTKEVDDGSYDWPPGRYCVHTQEWSCPPGLENGRIHLDNAKMTTRGKGVLPDHWFLNSIDLAFCCRNDGDGQPMKLPNSQPFILWMPYVPTMHGSNCQSVEGMEKVQTLIQIDIRQNGDLSVIGVTPCNLSTTAVSMVYCYYHPAPQTTTEVLIPTSKK